MKLTKGKITKLYSKNKQTKKRNKNQRRDAKTKTFRKRKPLDLSNRTLKRIPYGGADSGENETTLLSKDDSPLLEPVQGKVFIPGQEEENVPVKEEQKFVPENETSNVKESEVEHPDIQTSVGIYDKEDEPDNFALAQAFKILAEYVASRVANKISDGSDLPLKVAAEKLADLQFQKKDESKEKEYSGLVNQEN